MIAQLATSLRLSDGAVAEIFGDAPTDFPVCFGDALPLLAHRSGAVGITLFGRAYLLRRLRQDYSPQQLLTLIRHEAEHVRQQRADRLFHLRYALGWLRRFAALYLGRKLAGAGSRAGRCAHQAYLDLPSEREAYAVQERVQEAVDNC